jgi:hypothetical protein
LSTDSRSETSQTNVVEDLNVLDKQKDEPVGTPEEGRESNSCIVELKRKLNLAQKRTRKLNEEVEMLKNQVETVFNEDQIDFLKRGTMIGRQWKTDTIKKSLKLYSAFFLTVAIGNCMVKLIPPVNFCSDENIQTIFGTRFEDFLNYRTKYN